MSKLLFSFLLMLSMPASFAQKNNFGIINYTAPSGYDFINNESVLTYSKEDKSTGGFCNIFIYKMMPGRGAVKKDFDFAWTNLVQKPFKVTGTVNMQPATILKGWNLLMGTALYTSDGASTMAILSTFSRENSMQNICILSNSDAYNTDIENFIVSVDLSAENTTAAATQKIVPHPRYELWMSSQTNISTLQLEYRYIVLAGDGSCLYYLPEPGLYNLAKDDSKVRDSWGTITDKGDRLLLNHTRFGKMELYKKSPTALAPYANSKPFNYYKKCIPVDGLRLEGAYSPMSEYYTKKTDIIIRNIDPNKRPIIFFKKDGTYTNEGIEFSNITRGDDFAIGKGTYEIKDYSLILTTQSGRKLQVAFAGLLDANPKSNPGGYIINQNLFYKLDASFQPHR
jgi:hypothetical protein